MQLKLPPSVSICLSTCLAALLLGGQNVKEYCRQLEREHPEWGGLAEKLATAAEYTGLPQLFCAEKKLISQIANHLPMLGENDEATDLSVNPQIPRIVYVRVPALSQLNALRLSAPSQESTLNPAQLMSLPSMDFLNDTPPPSSEQIPTPASEPPSKRESEPDSEPAQPPAPTHEDIREAPTATTAAENADKPIRYRIMLLGDSLMEDLGPTAHRTLRHRKGLHFILTAKYSTGLSRPDYFNWPQNMQKTVSETRPDLIIFFMGANDGMPIKRNGKTVYPNSGEAWRKAYREKMAELFAIGRNHGCDMLWIGLPPMGSRYAKILAQTALAQQEGCAEHGISFVDTSSVLGDADGNFRTYMTDSQGNTVRLRAKDREHLSPMGNKLVIEHIMPMLEKKIADFRTKHPERCLSEKELTAPGRAPLEITIKYRPGKR